MDRKQFLCSLAGAGLSGAAASAKTGKKKSVPPLALTLLSPSLQASSNERQITPTRSIRLSLTSPRLAVVLQNISPHPLRVWGEDNSWGYNNLTLEISAIGYRQTPQPIVVRNGRLFFLGNDAQFLELAPGEMIMREVWLEPAAPQPGAHPSGVWLYKGFPWADIGLSNSVQMRAVYKISPEFHSQRLGVWTGQVASPEREYIIRRDASL